MKSANLLSLLFFVSVLVSCEPKENHGDAGSAQPTSRIEGAAKAEETSKPIASTSQATMESEAQPDSPRSKGIVPTGVLAMGDSYLKFIEEGRSEPYPALEKEDLVGIDLDQIKSEARPNERNWAAKPIDNAVHAYARFLDLNISRLADITCAGIHDAGDTYMIFMSFMNTPATDFAYVYLVRKDDGSVASFYRREGEAEAAKNNRLKGSATVMPASEPVASASESSMQAVVQPDPPKRGNIVPTGVLALGDDYLRLIAAGRKKPYPELNDEDVVGVDLHEISTEAVPVEKGWPAKPIESAVHAYARFLDLHIGELASTTCPGIYDSGEAYMIFRSDMNASVADHLYVYLVKKADGSVAHWRPIAPPEPDPKD